MTKDLEEKLNKTVNLISREFSPDKIILFGSHAWGNPTGDSDVDLLVIKNTENTRREAVLIDTTIYPRPFPLDIIVFTPAQVEERAQKGDFFILDILNKGKIVYAK